MTFLWFLLWYSQLYSKFHFFSLLFGRDPLGSCSFFACHKFFAYQLLLSAVSHFPPPPLLLLAVTVTNKDMFGLEPYTKQVYHQMHSTWYIKAIVTKLTGWLFKFSKPACINLSGIVHNDFRYVIVSLTVEKRNETPTHTSKSP